jgi:hypothetical protein
LKDGLPWEKLLQARFEEVDRAEWMAIISECMERGVFALTPPPAPTFSKAAGCLGGGGGC